MPLTQPVLTASRQSEDNSVLLEWTGTDDAESVEVERDGLVVATLGVGVISYFDHTAPDEACEYTIWALYSDKESNTVEVEAVPEPAPTAKIEYRLIDPANESVKGPIKDGDTVTKPFALQVLAPTLTIGSLRYSGPVSRVENNAPYSVFGDTGGDFAPANVAAGTMTLRTEVFSGNGATGTKLADETLHLTVQEAGTPEPPEPPVPPTPGTDADGTSTAGAWGMALLPVKPGMKVLGYTNFDEPRTLGQGFGSKLSGIWDDKREGGPDSSTRGTYSVAQTYEENNSLGRFFVHSAMAGGNQKAHDPMGKTHYVYAPVSRFGNLGETFVQFTCRFPTIPGRKMAHLLWNKGKEENGEIDIPEGKLDGGGGKGNMFIHYYLSSKQDTAKLNLNLQEKHHFGEYFRRKGFRSPSDPGEIIGYVDGKEIYHLNSAAGIPDGMFHVTQFETYLKGQEIPGWDKEDNAYHGTAGSGWAEYDKFRIDGPA
jgi:hypothetical protein